MTKASKACLPIGLLISRASMQEAFKKEELAAEAYSIRAEQDGPTLVGPLVPREPLEEGLEVSRVGDLATLRRILHEGWSVATLDKYGGTALHWAAGSGHLDCCKVPEIVRVLGRRDN